MSDPNSILTDQELRELFKSLLMEESGDGAFTESLVDMEALVAFSTPPSVVPPVGKEQQMLKKLHSKFGYQAVIKWLSVFVGGAVLVTTFLLMREPKQPAQPSVTNEIPVQVETPDPAQDLPAPVTVVPERHTTAAPAVPQNTSTDSFPSPKETVVAVNSTAPQISEQAGQKMDIDTVLSGITRLEVRGGFFDMNFKSTSDDQLRIRGHIDMKTKASVSEEQACRIRYERERQTLRIYIGRTGKQQRGAKARVDATLHFGLPKGTDLVVENTSGNLDADGMDGNTCFLTSSSGNIHAAHIGKANGNVSVRTSQGNITADHLRGNIGLATNSGNITLDQSEGNISIESQEGDQVLSAIKGNVNMKVQVGNLTGTNMTLTDNMTLSTDLGNIRMDLTNPPGDLSFDLQTSLGNINLDRSYGIEATGRRKVNVKKGRILVKAYTTNGNQDYE